MPIVINGSGTVTGLSAGGISNTKAIATAAMPAGSVIQVLQDTKTDSYDQTCSGTTTYTIPGLSQAITMTSASNKVLVQVSLAIGCSGSSYNGNAWWINRTTSSSDNAIAIGDQVGSSRGRGSRHGGRAYDLVHSNSEEITYLDTPGAGTHTYDIKFKDFNGDGGTVYLNRSASDSDSNSYVICCSTITLTEIAV